MLHWSNKAEVLRLHNLQSSQRAKFISDWNATLNELLPTTLLRKIKSSSLMSQAISAVADVYYTFVTICHCRKRLGQQYTYVAMCRPQHYEQEGVLLNKNYRTLLFVSEIVARNAVTPLIMRTFQHNVELGSIMKESLLSSLGNIIKGLIGNGEQILSNLEWVMLMLYMLGWNKHYNLIETVLGIQYAYTYKNDQLKPVSYKIEGTLILVTLSIKLARHLYFLYSHQQAGRKQPVPEKTKPSSGNSIQVRQKLLCRICYDYIKCRSATRCGHIFCWDCILKTLEISEECPVCRSTSKSAEVVQLKNF